MAAAVHSAFVFEDIDEASAELILQLQLTELEYLKDGRSGKQKEGTQDDGELAANLFEDNLQAIRMLIADRRMTKSIADAVQADGALLTRSKFEEETARKDHAFTHRLNGSNVTSEVNLQSESIDIATLSKLAGR